MSQRVVYIVDDDRAIRASLEMLIPLLGDCRTVSFESGDLFLSDVQDLEPGCLLLDLCMPGLSGLEVLDCTRAMPGHFVPVIMSGHSDIDVAVRAMKLGAFDYIAKEKQFERLAPILESAFEHLENTQAEVRAKARAAALLDTLSQRECEVLSALLDGHANKGIAHRLNISPRTVEVHRAKLMEKLGTRNLQETLRIAFAGGKFTH